MLFLVNHALMSSQISFTKVNHKYNNFNIVFVVFILGNQDVFQSPFSICKQGPVFRCGSAGSCVRRVYIKQDGTESERRALQLVSGATEHLSLN